MYIMTYLEKEKSNSQTHISRYCVHNQDKGKDYDEDIVQWIDR